MPATRSHHYHHVADVPVSHASGASWAAYRSAVRLDLVYRRGGSLPTETPDKLLLDILL